MRANAFSIHSFLSTTIQEALYFFVVGAGFYCENFYLLESSTCSTHFGTPNYNTYTLRNAWATIALPRRGEKEEQPSTPTRRHPPLSDGPQHAEEVTHRPACESERSASACCSPLGSRVATQPPLGRPAIGAAAPRPAPPHRPRLGTTLAGTARGRPPVRASTTAAHTAS